MKTTIFLFALLLITCAPTVAQHSSRINFHHGAYSSVLSGSLGGYKTERNYLLRVRDGQTIRTEQIKSSRSLEYITIYITDPNGQPVGDSDASCNDHREITPTVSGDYRIRVVECRKADPWRGTFRFRVSVR